jgi:hypothetical protein
MQSPDEIRSGSAGTTAIRTVASIAVALSLVAGCGAAGGPGQQGASADDPATEGMDRYLAGDFQGALEACEQLEARSLASEEMQLQARGCLALRPAIGLLSDDYETARSHIAAGCESAPELGHDKDHYCAFVLVTFSIHADDEQFMAAETFLTDTFLTECGVSVSEINVIIEEMKSQMEGSPGQY